MPRIDEMPEYRAQLGRTSHDLSHKLGFTATVAHLMPVFHDWLNPGETVELGVSYNLRTQPLQSAAMVDINSHVEYFFVPINLLYEPFSNVYYNVSDQYSSNYQLTGASIENTLPVLNFNDELKEIMTANISLYEYDAARCYRLLDLLGYNVRWFGGDSQWNPNVFPYPILAYNCIYQYYYRLDTREQFDQKTFNWDMWFSTNQPIDHSNWSQKNMMIQYRPKNSDYFTDVKVSPIVDVLNLNNTNSLDTVNQWLSRGSVESSGRSFFNVIKSGSVGVDNGSALNSPNSTSVTPRTSIQTNFGFSSSPGSTVSSNLSDNGFPNGEDINTANIRALFANEKLWSITGRAKKNYDDQTLAHFGYQVPHDPKHEISCFGHDRGQIHIGEVISTADTTNAALGEIAGKGYGQLANKPHKFTAPCHGVVMAILSFVPDLTYSETYLKANAVAKREDFYIPEYDHLGMQPLFGYEKQPWQGPNRNDIQGWQYRYEQYKRRYNRVTSAFARNGSLKSWMLGIEPPLSLNAANTESYVSGYLYRPDSLNQVMLVNYAGSVTAPSETMYDGDPFVVDSYIHCKKVSTMSDYSLPRLDA